MKAVVELWQGLDDWHKAFVLSVIGSILLFFIFLILCTLGGLP